MMPEELPHCVCGLHKWNSGGGSFGVMSQQGFTCHYCGRHASIIFYEHAGCFITTEEYTDNIDNYKDWLNNTLLITMRAYGELVEIAQKKIYQRWLAQFKSRHVRYFDYTTIGALKGHDDKLWEFGCKQAEKLYRKPYYLNPKSVKLPALSKLPEGLQFAWFVGGGDNESNWQWVHHRNTEYIECPPDPIRVKHDAYWNEIFAKFPNVFDKREEIKNRYCGAACEPWYKIMIPTAQMIIGPRKRVDSIQVTFSRKVNVSCLRDIAKADGTTYTADGGWQGISDEATEIEIHAWTKEKVVEYLTIILEICNV